MNERFERKLELELAELRAAGTYKELRHLTTPMAAHVRMEEAGDVIVLSSNNYLGLASDERVIAAGVAALHEYGAGSASVRFICGTYNIHRNLEERTAVFVGTDAALSYMSCWAANEGLIPVIADENATIISDELNHASIIDGCRLSKAKRTRYGHGNMSELEALLKAARAAGSGEVFIITDGVFSMEGSIAKLPEIITLAKRFDAVTIVDDSHAIGVLGAKGRGTPEYFDLVGQVDIVTGTYGKALGGAAGGFVAGPKAVIEMLVQRSRTQLFSNSLPPTVAASSLRALEILDAEPERVAKLRESTRYFRSELRRLGYQPLEGESAIIPIIVGETATAIAMSDALLKMGVFVTGFGYPVVPEGAARIRVQMSAALERSDLDRALAAFEVAGRARSISNKGSLA